MKILHITDTNLAYAPIRFVHLINKYTSHQARLIQLKDFFQSDLSEFTNKIYQSDREILDCLGWADIYHFHSHRSLNLRRFFKKPPPALSKILSLPKPYILHYHGSPHRENPSLYQTKLPLLVSTPEMLPLFPNSQFFPNLIDEKSNLYPPSLPNNSFSICHNFSLHPKLKDTDIFQQIPHFHPEIQTELIPRLSLRESIRRRTPHPCIFDHLQGYYGFISIESLAQGIAVINACSPYVQDELINFFGTLPPFFITSKSTFQQDLLELKKTYRTYQQKGLEYIQTYWSGQKNIQRLIKIYQSL